MRVVGLRNFEVMENIIGSIMGGLWNWISSLFSRTKKREGTKCYALFGDAKQININLFINEQTAGTGGLLKQILTGEAQKQLGE